MRSQNLNEKNVGFFFPTRLLLMKILILLYLYILLPTTFLY